MNKGKAVAYFMAFVIFFILYDILALSTYNNDWDAYEQMYLGVFDSSDFFFQYLISFANNIGLTYSQFYTVVQLFIYICCILFYLKFVKRGMILLLGVLLIVASPNLPILIRYYLAFSIFLLSNITRINGNKTLTCFLLLIAFFTHSAILICFPLFFGVWYLEKKRQERIYCKLLALALLIGVIKFFIFDFLTSVGLNVFSSYTDDVASVSSTIFMDCLYFSWFCSCYYIHSKVKKTCSLWYQDKQYMFLYSSVLYPILFVFISNIMIVQFRLYEPFVIISLVYMLYAKNKYLNQNIKVIGLIVCLLFLSFFMKYILLGLMTGGISEWFVHYSEIILSNDRSIILKLI